MCLTVSYTESVEWVLHDRARCIMNLCQPWVVEGNQAVNTKQSVKIKVNI